MVQQSTIDRQISEANKFYQASNPQQYYASKSAGVQRLIDRGLALKGLQRQTPLKQPSRSKPIVLSGTPSKPSKSTSKIPKVKPPPHFGNRTTRKNIGTGRNKRSIFYSRHSPKSNIRKSDFSMVFPRGLSNISAKMKIVHILKFIKFKDKSKNSFKSYYVTINGTQKKSTNARKITAQQFLTDFQNEVNSIIDLYFGSGGITDIEISITEVL